MKPLTESQIYALRAAVPDGEWMSAEEALCFEAGVRAAEKYHGSQEPEASAFAQSLVPVDGYVDAFYELASLMGIGVQSIAPAYVWREQMLPRLRAALSAPAPSDLHANDCAHWGGAECNCR